MDRLNEVNAFLGFLDEGKILYELSNQGMGILVEVYTEKHIWEIQYTIYGDIEIEVFKSDGQTYGISQIDDLFRDYGEHIRRAPVSIRNLEKYTREELFEFLRGLDEDKIFYKLRRDKTDESILVQVVNPGERWQIKYTSDGSIEIEKFERDGDIMWERKNSSLVVIFSEKELS